MNPRLKKFKILTTWVTEDRVENLLEGTLYLKEAFKFIDLLLALDNQKFSYKLVSGFKGFTHFKEKQNMFKDIVLEVSSEQELKNVVEFLRNSVKYNEIFNVSESNTILNIQLKD